MRDLQISRWQAAIAQSPERTAPDRQTRFEHVSETGEKQKEKSATAKKSLAGFIANSYRYAVLHAVAGETVTQQCG